jgi:putative redox protein
VTIRVVRDQTAPMRHEIHIGRNSLAADGTPEEGGEGSAPSPHDLYDAALGACKALTVLWYAKHKNIPVEGIEVSVERDASQERSGIYRLGVELSLTGNLTASPTRGTAACREEVPHPQAHDRGQDRDFNFDGRSMTVSLTPSGRAIFA